MSTKRQQAMIAAKSSAPVKRRAEISFDEFYDTYLDELTAMYTAAVDGLTALGLFREKKRSFVDFVDWCYAQYSSFEIVSDSDEDDDEDEEEEEEEDEDESETDESELDSDELGSDDPSSFDGESADDDDEDEDEDDAEETAE